MLWPADPMTVAANALLWGSALSRYRRWRWSASHVAEAQRARLFSILRSNADTAFGRVYGFRRLFSVADYQIAVPLSAYADYEPYVQRIAAGESSVLTAAPLINLAPSSGSTAPSKLIPYTEALKSEFQAGIDPWLFSLFLAHPALLMGKQYWSITPGGQQVRLTPGGVPIGFEQDTEYFGPVKRRIIETTWAVPPAVSQIRDGEAFRYVVLLFLLRCSDLALISVWNPTFFMLLLDGLKSWRPRLLADIERGGLNPPARLDAAIAGALKQRLKPAPRRARTLAGFLEAAEGDLATPIAGARTLGELVWPRLRLISCWADGPAQPPARQLQRLFPSVALQPKGLLATEGIVSFPLGGLAGTALSLNSHFLEFLPADQPPASAAPRLAHQLEAGATYTVALTTGGGLYRCQLGDQVQVTGFEQGCPLIRFVGRSDAVVDLFGEKLNEAHARRAGQMALAAAGVAPGFWMLAPEKEGESQGHYTLFVQGGLPLQEPELNAKLQELAVSLDAELQENFHYRHCRRLGQLTGLRALAVSPEIGDANEIFLTTCAALGQRLGDVKPSALSGHTGWAAVFAPRRLEGPKGLSEKCLLRPPGSMS